MLYVFWAGLTATAAAALQETVAAAGLPVLLQPDFGLLAAGAALAFGRREFACLMLFAAAFQADLLGAERLGVLTLCALSAGGLLFGLRRELVRGGLKAAWGTAVGLTFLTHVFYLCAARLGGLDAAWGEGLRRCLWLAAAACLWALPAAWLFRELWGRSGALAFEARRRWEAAREAAERRRRDKRISTALRRI